MTRAFVFDLDGVIRHWDSELVTNAERTNGLPAGALFGVSFETDLLLAAVSGAISDDAWRTEVATRLQSEYPNADGAGAVRAWSEPVGEIISGSLDALARAKEHGNVCLLSNATSRLESDLETLGLADEFAHIFNSSEIGFAKPDRRVYEHVEQVLGVSGDQIVYIDDGAANVDAAAELGWISLLASPDTRLSDLLAPWFS